MHAITMGLVVCASLLVFDPHAVLNVSFWGITAGLPAGIAGGLVIIVADGAIVRSLAGWERRTAASFGDASRATRGEGAQQVRSLAPGSSEPRRRVVGIFKAKGTFVPSAEDYQVALGWLLSVAALEELVFRGVLVQAALLLPGIGWQAVAIAAGTVIFALSHVFFGWSQVLAKLPLSAVAILQTLLTGSVCGAIATHGIFNFYVWRYQKSARITYRESSVR
ncbi:CPBP family intramembrane glutamic endopeptidase [Amycolatopsis sp. CFH S0740]|uniref:CPBP family intramembrane glutamic endopeptidase n=1 Tax=Amycolatopsis sp. CFH S0740 TaxID=1644111 RepID=UPI0014308684|nr:CPBP family intramembrane glutamic endopeptidase [Amycolatopsis sp. CFH S0740]